MICREFANMTKQIKNLRKWFFFQNNKLSLEVRPTGSWPYLNSLQQQVSIYRMRAIISRGLYIFTPFFIAVYIVERLILQPIYVQTRKCSESSV